MLISIFCGFYLVKDVVQVNCFLLSQAVFSVCPLSVTEWLVVLKISFPVIILDETMKFFSRRFVEGRNPFSELHWMLAIWAGYIALMLYSPF